MARVLDRVEYLAHLGGYGALIGIVQSALLERRALQAVWQDIVGSGGRGESATWGGPSGSESNGAIVGGLGGGLGGVPTGGSGGEWLREAACLELGFVLSLVGFYMLVAMLLERGSSATLMNLSLLTSDFFAVGVGVGLLHCRPGLPYAAAFTLTILGLGIFHCDIKVAHRHISTLPSPPVLTQPLVADDAACADSGADGAVMRGSA